MRWQDLLLQQTKEISSSLKEIFDQQGGVDQFDEIDLEADILPDLPEDLVLKAYHAPDNHFFQKHLKEALTFEFEELKSEANLFLNREKSSYFSYLLTIAQEIEGFDLSDPLKHIFDRQLLKVDAEAVDTVMGDVEKQAFTDLLGYVGYAFGHERDVALLDGLFYTVEDKMIKMEALRAMVRLAPENASSHLVELMDDASFEAKAVILQLSYDPYFRQKLSQKIALLPETTAETFFEEFQHVDAPQIEKISESVEAIRNKVGGLTVLASQEMHEDQAVLLMSEHRLSEYLWEALSEQTETQPEKYFVSLFEQSSREFANRLSTVVSDHLSSLQNDLELEELTVDKQHRLASLCRLGGDICLVSSQFLFDELATTMLDQIRFEDPNYEVDLLKEAVYALEQIGAIGLSSDKPYWSRFYFNPLISEDARQHAFTGFARAFPQDAVQEAKTVHEAGCLSLPKIAKCWDALEDIGTDLKEEWLKGLSPKERQSLLGVSQQEPKQPAKRATHLRLVPKS